MRIFAQIVLTSLLTTAMIAALFASSDEWEQRIPRNPYKGRQYYD